MSHEVFYLEVIYKHLTYLLFVSLHTPEPFAEYDFPPDTLL